MAKKEIGNRRKNNYRLFSLMKGEVGGGIQNGEGSGVLWQQCPQQQESGGVNQICALDGEQWRVSAPRSVATKRTRNT